MRKRKMSTGEHFTFRGLCALWVLALLNMAGALLLWGLVPSVPPKPLAVAVLFGLKVLCGAYVAFETIMDPVGPKFFFYLPKINERIVRHVVITGVWINSGRRLAQLVVIAGLWLTAGSIALFGTLGEIAPLLLLSFALAFRLRYERTPLPLAPARLVTR